MEEQIQTQELVESSSQTTAETTPPAAPTTEAPTNKVSEQEKEANLKAKLQIIEELKRLTNSEESAGNTFNEFRALQERWKSIGQVPASQVSGLWNNFHLQVEIFYNKIKINKELRDMDLKHNLEEKSKLCAIAEELTQQQDIASAFKTLQNLHSTWKEIGPVAKEFKDQLWERFKNATATINDSYHKFIETQRAKEEQTLALKETICEKAAEIANSTYSNIKEWQNATEQLIQLQTEWKEVGEVSVKERAKLYKKFRISCDKFFNDKRDFYQDISDEQSKNLELKKSLCERVEALQNSEDWKAATEAILEAQKEWKEIGAVSQKYSQKIWNRFRAACDIFFNRKSEHFKSIDSEQTENLAAKQNIIAQLTELTLTGDSAKDIEKIKELQSEWNHIGHVPMKDKDSINEQYKSITYRLYANLNITEKEREIERYRNKVKGFDNNKEKNAYKIVSEREKLVSQIHQLENDIKTLENNMGFFSASKKANSLLEGIQKSLNASKERLSLLKIKLNELDKII